MLAIGAAALGAAALGAAERKQHSLLTRGDSGNAQPMHEVAREEVGETESMSQYKQDLRVLEHHKHKRKGTYLEIGVWDGESISNTALLDRKYGWSGVCVDPFMKNMSARTCQQVHAALGSRALSAT